MVTSELLLLTKIINDKALSKKYFSQADDLKVYTL